MATTRDIPAVILAGGEASRFQKRLNKTIDKCLLKPLDRPLIDYTLDNVRKMGSRRLIVVGREKHGALEAHLARVAGDMDITVLPRDSEPGLANALKVIEPHIDSTFILLCGDELYLDANFHEMLGFFTQSGAEGVCVVHHGGRSRLKENYAVECSDGRVVSVIEKPLGISPTALMGCGAWILPPAIFSIVRSQGLNRRTGKKELVDTIDLLIRDNHYFVPFAARGSYLNVNHPEDILNARKLILDHLLAHGGISPDMTPPFPDEFQLEPTVRCNLDCTMCTSERRDNPCPDMDFETFLHIRNQFPTLQIARLHGIGESLLNPDFPRFVETLKRQKCFVAFNDNFLLMDEKLSRQLVAWQVDEIRASCDAPTPERYAAIRGSDRFNDWVAGVEALRTAREESGNRKPKLVLVSVLLEENLDVLSEIVSLASRIGLDEVSFQNQLSFGQPRGEPFSIPRAEEALSAARERARALNIPMKAPHLTEKRIPSCIWPWAACYITADAYITPCCNIQNPEVLNFGNLKTESLPTIWNSEEYGDFRKGIVTHDPHPSCRSCPYYEGTFKTFFD